MDRRPAPSGQADWQQGGNTVISEPQRRMLNAVCGDLAKGLPTWHGNRMDKDDWRHFFAGTVMGFRAMPGWDFGDGRRPVIMLGRSSLDLSRDEAKDAITLAIMLGDDPGCQGLKWRRVEWSRAVLLGMGYTEDDLRRMQ